MSFVFQNGNVEELVKRIEKLESYHNTPTPSKKKISDESGKLIITEYGLELESE